MPVVTANAAGNRVMLKPSKLTPATNAVIASMFSEIFGIYEQGSWNGMDLLHAPFTKNTERLINLFLR